MNIDPSFIKSVEKFIQESEEMNIASKSSIKRIQLDVSSDQDKTNTINKIDLS